MLLGAGLAGGETLKVTRDHQFLYPAPDFAATPLGSVPVGAEVKALGVAGDWYQVEYQGRTGWLPRSACPPGGLPAGMERLLSGGEVRGSSHDEVALAGKAEKMPPASLELYEPGETIKVARDGQFLYPEPNSRGGPLGPVPRGAEVKLVQKTGDWYKVKYQGQEGWLPARACRQP